MAGAAGGAQDGGLPVPSWHSVHSVVRGLSSRQRILRLEGVFFSTAFFLPFLFIRNPPYLNPPPARFSSAATSARNIATHLLHFRSWTRAGTRVFGVQPGGDVFLVAV